MIVLVVPYSFLASRAMKFQALSEIVNNNVNEGGMIEYLLSNILLEGVTATNAMYCQFCNIFHPICHYHGIPIVGSTLDVCT